ncbi:peroxidase [Bombyx mori]
MLPAQYGAEGRPRVAKSGRPLPDVRTLRVSIMSDGRVAHPHLTQMVTNYNVFIAGDVTSVHDTVNYVAVTTACCSPGGEADPRCLPIRVPDDDVHLRRSNVRCLNLTRAITYQRLGCVSNNVPGERINTATPMLDLSIVYGNNAMAAARGRQYEGGRLRADILKGKDWPPSGSAFCINNEANETRCHDAPTNGANSLLGINMLFLWLYRNHNSIARRLQTLNRCWDDDRIFFTAKEINIAMYLQILYYELMPVVLGKEFLLNNKVIFDVLGHVNDYDDRLMPTVSLEYIIGTRWFHTIQEGRLRLYTKEGKIYDEQPIVDLTLRTGALPINNTLEGVTQGAFRQPCADTDNLVDPDIGERILGRLQFASDVVSSDIMKGRDLGLPPYNDYRRLCGLPVAKKFKDLLRWMRSEQVEAMSLQYESTEDIDLMAGIIAEWPAKDAVVGPTLRCIMATQMKRWRRADRFWYENDIHPGALTQDQLVEIRKISMAKIMCDHGDQVEDIQPNVFILPGYGNELTKCSSLPTLDWQLWKDQSCDKTYKKQDSDLDEYGNVYIY